MEIEQISKQTYDNYLKQVNINTFLQKSEMSEVLKANNSKTEFLGLIDNGKVLAVAFAVIRNVWGGKDRFDDRSHIDKSRKRIYFL